MTRVLLAVLSVTVLAVGCRWCHIEPEVETNPGVSLVLRPVAPVFDVDQVPQGAVRFTVAIKNEWAIPVTIAHPSICFPADYKQGEIRHFADSHGKSEILLSITKPDGAVVTLRDGSIHFFDPGNVPVLAIPPHGTGTFDVGWFFQNARGRWEQDDIAAKVFLAKGTYRVRLLFRNAFPKAALYDDNTGKPTFANVWTGELRSAEIAVEVK